MWKGDRDYTSKQGVEEKEAAAAAIHAMDLRHCLPIPPSHPHSAGEYDPRRAKIELARRQEARQDIKAAHKALILASSGKWGVGWEVWAVSGEWWRERKVGAVRHLSSGSPDTLPLLLKSRRCSILHCRQPGSTLGGPIRVWWFRSLLGHASPARQRAGAGAAGERGWGRRGSTGVGG